MSRLPLLFLLLLPGCIAGLTQASDQVSAARLVVVISVDQLRNDRLTEELPGGLGRLVREGRRFVSSSVDHAVTETCPGHAVIMTGLHPARAGIPGNRYVDRQRWGRRYCVDDEDPDRQVLGGSENRSPWMLRGSTLGDWLKQRDGDARVFAVAGKDRAAIMLGGIQPDGVFWFAPDMRAFTSSRYYMATLPGYVRDFNTSLLSHLPETWTHPPGSFRADDYPGESDENDRVSGHPVTLGEDAGRQIQQSPFVDELTLALAGRIVAQEQLGQRGSTDLLALSLSASDTVGHLYGPFSAESEDTLARLDRALQRFLLLLDREVGAGHYLVALTSDHGVTDLPEYSIARGENTCPVPGGRVSYLGLVLDVYWPIYRRFTAPFDPPGALVRISGSQVYLNAEYMKAEGLQPDDVLKGVETILEDARGVREAWTRREIEQGRSEEARLLRQSLVPDRGGDLFVQLHAGCVIGSDGTSHGMPYPHDRLVPVLFYGHRVVPGLDPGAARSVDVAPTLARLLDIPAPSGLDGVAVLDGAALTR